MKTNSIIPSDKEIQFTAYLNGEPDAADFGQADQKEMDDLLSAWETSGTAFAYGQADEQGVWDRLQNEMNQSSKSKRFGWQLTTLKYAAGILLVLALGWGISSTLKPNKTQLTVVNTPVQIQKMVVETVTKPTSPTKIVLPDGSIVLANASTRLEYPKEFGGRKREVTLSGEAFFEIVRDTLHPFVIHTVDAAVEVLGTSFNVSAYPGAEKVEVNVRTGKVKLSLINSDPLGNSFKILPAGNRGWVDVSNRKVDQQEGLDPNYNSWVTRKITFQRTPLSEVFKTLENTYQVRIITNDPSIGRIHYTANFENLDLDYILKVIALTHHLQVKTSGDKVLFTKANS